MFSSFSITGAAAEVYDVELAYEDARRGRRDGEKASTTTTTTEVTFDSKEDPEEVIDKLVKQRRDLPYETGYECVVIRALCSASKVAIQLGVEKYQPRPGGVEGDFEWKDERGTVALELGVGAQALSARLAAEAERARWIVVHGFVFTR